MTAEGLLQEIDQRGRALYARVAAGHDAPPAHGLRLEGLREAAVLTGAAGEVELQELLDAAHGAAWGESLAERLGQDWQLAHPFPEVPVFMARAPVSTGKVD